MGLINWLKRFKFGLSIIYKQYVAPLDPSGYGRLGKNSIIKNNSSLIKQNIIVDDWVVIQDHLNFISNKGKLIVGKYSVISSGCTIVPGAHKLTVGVPFYLATTNHINDDEGDIIIDEDCWVGTGCILLPKVHIGRGAVIGAGSVVTKDVPPYAVVVGAPARIVATKFSLEQVFNHEKVLYPKNQRMKQADLEELFVEKYSGLKSIGVEMIDDMEPGVLEVMRDEIGMANYNSDY